MSRIVSWFSCGAASAVATKLIAPDVIAACTIIRALLDEKHCGELDDDALDELVIEMLDVAVGRLCEQKHEVALQ